MLPMSNLKLKRNQDFIKKLQKIEILGCIILICICCTLNTTIHKAKYIYIRK